jgi:hypothetical protein
MVIRGAGFEPARAETPRCYRPLPYHWASHGERKEGESNPLGQCPDGFRSRSPDQMASLPRATCMRAKAEGEGVEPPDPLGSTAFKAAWRAHAEPSGGR